MKRRNVLISIIVRIKVNEKLQRSLIKRYWRKSRRVLAQTTAAVVEMSRKMQPEALRMMVGGIKDSEHIRTHILDLWGDVGGRFARDMDKSLSRKAQEDYDWDAIMRNYINERAMIKADKILSTQQEEINRIIDTVVNEGERLGWSTDRISEELTGQLKRDMTRMQGYQAERIARTEVIGASNKGSFESAMRSGLQMRKAWLTSGLPGVRDSHLYYESLGNVPMDYEYSVGLKQPGDPAAEPAEIINCRCTIIYEVD